VQSQLKVELDSAMMVFSDRSIVPHFQPGNQPVEKVGDIFSGRARYSVRSVFGIYRAAGRGPALPLRIFPSFRAENF
jgi:hypothetical protein